MLFLSSVFIKLFFLLLISQFYLNPKSKCIKKYLKTLLYDFNFNVMLALFLYVIDYVNNKTEEY